MTPKQKKLIIIVVPTVVIVIIAIIMAILYFSTDFLKSDKTLFLKYISQNVDIAKMVMDDTSEKEYTNMLRQNKYKSTAELTANYTQDINSSQENSSNDINKVKLKVDSQSDYINNYNYKDLQLIYDNENLFRTEYIQDGNIYGLRFPDMFSQFLSVENNNLKEVAQKAGLTEEQIEFIPDTIEEIDYNSMFSFTDEEIAQLQNKYIGVISNNISKDKYSKLRDAMITVGENSITTTAYSATLTKEQANDIYVKMLEELKNDEIILNKIAQNEVLVLALSTTTQDVTNKEQISDMIKQNIIEIIDRTITEIQDNNIGTNEVKCTVYAYKGKTVRTALITETQEIIIDSDTTDTGISVNIQNSNANQNQENTRTLKILKNNSATEDTFSIELENTLGNIISTAEIYRNKKLVDGSGVNVETGLTYNDGQDNLLEIKYDENVEFVGEIEPEVVLDEKNNVVLNDYDEERVSAWIGQVRDRLNEKLQENAEIINNISKSEVLGTNKEEVKIEQTEGVTEIERNRFNSKFEFYAGEDIASEQVLELIEASKDSLKNAQVSYSENGSTSSSSDKKLQSLRLEIEKGAENKNLADSVKDMIEVNKKYTVTIQYNNDTGVVSFMTITINN